MNVSSATKTLCTPACHFLPFITAEGTTYNDTRNVSEKVTTTGRAYTVLGICSFDVAGAFDPMAGAVEMGIRVGVCHNTSSCLNVIVQCALR